MPLFNKRHNYNPDSGVTSIKFGERSPLLEVELNEMQSIQDYHRQRLIKSVIGNAIHIPDKEITVLNGEAVFRNVTLFLDGNIFSLNCTVLATEGQTLYFSYQEEEASYMSELRQHGNLDAMPIDNYLVDDRVKKETSRRYQLVYKITTSLDGALRNVATLGKVTNGKLPFSLDTDITLLDFSSQISKAGRSLVVFEEGEEPEVREQGKMYFKVTGVQTEDVNFIKVSPTMGIEIQK